MMNLLFAAFKSRVACLELSNQAPLNLPEFTTLMFEAHRSKLELYSVTCH